MDHEMNPIATGFLSLEEEIQLYILSYLPCQDILRCTSVCKAIRQVYMSSCLLQYFVELSGQRLLPIPSTDNENIPVSRRLQLLRDKAHAWFKVDTHSFETVSLPKNMHSEEKVIADGHIYLWDQEKDMATIVPILPQPSQKTVRRDWSPGTLCLAPGSESFNLDVFMDPAQNLIAIAYYDTDDALQPDDATLCINLQALDHDGVHPQAAGQTLDLWLPEQDDGFMVPDSAKLKGSGRFIALHCSYTDTFEGMWQLQILDWQHSTTSNSVLSDIGGDPDPIDFCFIENNRLLVVADDLKLYSIEDMSGMPQLLARFLMPVRFMTVECLLPLDHIEHGSPQIQAQQKMFTSDPKNRLLCIITEAHLVYIISTRIFFNLEGMAAATPIPWERWGPPNTRIFELPNESKVHVSGNRVLQTLQVNTSASGHYEHVLHMMDFSPLAVTNRRGLGRVVKEPSTVIDIDESKLGGRPATSLTTSLPYVEVVLDRKLGSAGSELADVWIDMDRIYLLNEQREHEVEDSADSEIELQYSELEENYLLDEQWEDVEDSADYEIVYRELEVIDVYVEST